MQVKQIKKNKNYLLLKLIQIFELLFLFPVWSSEAKQIHNVSLITTEETRPGLAVQGIIYYLYKKKHLFSVEMENI